MIVVLFLFVCMICVMGSGALVWICQGLIRRFQPVIEERIAGGPALYDAEKAKYFQGSWSGLPFNNKVLRAISLRTSYFYSSMLHPR